MDVGIGLPSTIPATSGSSVLDWARQAESAGFSSLGTLDRVVFDNFDPIPTLAAAAAVTHRIRLTTAILIAPYRGNGTLLVKQLATIDRLSEGRLTVGLGVGSRDDDYAATHTPFDQRGRRHDALLAEMDAVWNGEVRGNGLIGPVPVQPGGPPLLIGGNGNASIRRVHEHGAGWISGGGGADDFAAGARAVETAWTTAGRNGVPRLAALTYFALGPNAERHATDYLTRYYDFLGPAATQIAAGAHTTLESVTGAIRDYAAAGCDELIFFPCTNQPDQIPLLATAAKL